MNANDKAGLMSSARRWDVGQISVDKGLIDRCSQIPVKCFAEATTGS